MGEKELRAEFDRLRFEAPNPRDFRSWSLFYEAQAEHEGKLAAIEREIEQVVRLALDGEV